MVFVLFFWVVVIVFSIRGMMGVLWVFMVIEIR